MKKAQKNGKGAKMMKSSPLSKGVPSDQQKPTGLIMDHIIRKNKQYWISDLLHKKVKDQSRSSYAAGD